jgi:Tfp pilus assembly protein PilO
MKAKLERWLRRLGPAGVLGIGVLLACAGFFADALSPLEDQVRAQRAALERLRNRTPYQPVSTGREEDLQRFYALFPSTAQLADEVERLHRFARKSGLELAQGEYRLERRADGLWAYRVTLPVRGSYTQFRDFLSAVLAGMPVASIDALRFERKKPLDTQLEAQVRLTLHTRPAGDVQ